MGALPENKPLALQRALALQRPLALQREFEKLRYGKQYGYEVLFKRQDPRPVGKVGVIIGEMGMPEVYDFRFYDQFMAHVFGYVLPPFLKPIVLADRGIGLIDPDHPLAREEFKPGRLVDPQGSFTNHAGVPYVDCPVKWVPPAMKKNAWDHGYFLYKGDGGNGSADVCDKVGAKIAGWYYGKLLPEQGVPWKHQQRLIYEEVVLQLSALYPEIQFRQGFYILTEQLRDVVEDLIQAGCQTVLYQGTNCPVYCDFEDYGHALELVHEYARGRAKVIMCDQLGCQPEMREAFFAMLCDQLALLPGDASVMVVLSIHGHPFKKETQDKRARLYREPLEAGVRQILEQRGGQWKVIWSQDEYAEDYQGPKDGKKETRAAYEEGIREGFDFVIELPTEFVAENTDLMIFHAMKKFSAFSSYSHYDPIPYTDWEKPLVRVFSEGKTTGVYAGVPVGPYRHYVVDAAVRSICQVLDGQ